ncbi:MAG: C4-type zinc ribbon domain-containing protein [Spirochaetaceae bacterium]|jgi:predicted  nucleic acid-binding Zn-ribbon protein|nr:C4-type zinc ribbon domain-containing protein [Spirochaetaceae bacterium]
MTMEEILGKLRGLQEILSQKIVLEQEVSEIPKILTTQEELLSRLKKSFIEKDQEYNKAKTHEAEFRELLIQAEQAREHAEKNMDTITTQREYEALDKEIRDAADREAQYRKDLQKEERLLADLKEQMDQSAGLIEQQEAELAELRSGVERQVAEKTAKVRELEEAEKNLNLDMDPEVLFKFERIIRNKMGRGIVAIRGNVCMGCHMILPIQFANQVRMGEDIVFCPYCSRILYYEESEDGEEDYFDADDAGSLADLDDIDDEDYDEEDGEEELINIDYEE